MHPFPHSYVVNAKGGPDGTVDVTSEGLPALETTPPPAFDGPDGYWSPETLLTASVSDCFILTFRGVSKANRFEWQEISVETEAILERVDRVTYFTKLILRPILTLEKGADEEKAHKLLEKAEKVCLITSSFKAEIELEVELRWVEPVS